jgi:hypothetical protein
VWKNYTLTKMCPIQVSNFQFPRKTSRSCSITNFYKNITKLCHINLINYESSFIALITWCISNAFSEFIQNRLSFLVWEIKVACVIHWRPQQGPHVNRENNGNSVKEKNRTFIKFAIALDNLLLLFPWKKE